MTKIPSVIMRGGTSRGPFFLAQDLPSDPKQRDAVLVAAMGSGHPLQVDGIGGGNPLTSKVAIISKSERPDADVDYLFAQVNVEKHEVDTAPNCGNMLAGVGPFAIEQGLIQAQDPETTLVVYNVNTKKRIEVVIQTPNRHVTYEGDATIAGVPGKAAPVRMTFLDAAGSKTGKLLPTGNLVDRIDGIEATLFDMAVAAMLVRASDLGKTGYEAPTALDQDHEFLTNLQSLRIEAGRRMGLGDVTNMVIPKPILVSPPKSDATINVRYFMPHSCHTAVAITGAICVATACCTDGTIASQYANMPEPDKKGVLRLLIEHPSGQTPVEIVRNPNDGTVLRASVIRTARRLFEGAVIVPDNLVQ